MILYYHCPSKKMRSSVELRNISENVRRKKVKQSRYRTGVAQRFPGN